MAARVAAVAIAQSPEIEFGGISSAIMWRFLWRNVNDLSATHTLTHRLQHLAASHYRQLRCAGTVCNRRTLCKGFEYHLPRSLPALGVVERDRVDFLRDPGVDDGQPWVGVRSHSDRHPIAPVHPGA